ncbi:high mobility group protein 20A-like [Littorina saxatilis]|uniref:HMG box domain-containing protein n=1 Tax=Littorina saxatilis TaxID=31220 RepID=A0AAN9AZU2_9CAEN
MDLGPRASATMLSGMSGLTQFHNLDDDVAKETNDLTVESGFSTDGGFLGPSDLRGVGTLHGAGVSLSDSNEPHEQSKRKGGWTKGKKRTKKGIKDANAPKMPLSGYLRYLTERREKLRMENPSLSFTEISKQLGAEWSSLPQHEKQRYLDEAEKDKERYNREMEAYQQTDAYRAFKKQLTSKSKDNEAEATQHIPNTNLEVLNLDEDESGTFDIPIFTEEFLDHNKVRDGELRQLRKQTTELEEQNAILSKHMENMRQAVERLETETSQMRSSNTALHTHHHALNNLLTQRFSNLPLPGTKEYPTLDTIDSYMSKLHNIVLNSPQQHPAFVSTAVDIISRLGNMDDKL